MNAPGLCTVTSLQPESGYAARLVADCSRARQQWAARPISARLAVVRKFRDRLAAECRDIAAEIDQRPVADTLVSEVLPLLAACRYLERNAARILRPRRRRQRAGFWLGRIATITRREPFGTVLIVGPSNYGLMLPGIQALQALVAGNAVLIKPAPGSAAVLERFASLLGQGGLPAGLVTILGESTATAGELVRGLVDKVVFTGSSEAGRTVLSQASEHLVPATVELSGWDACIVLDSADLDRTARAIAFALEFNGGRSCIAPRRILVSGSRHDALVDRLTAQIDRRRSVCFTGDTARTAAPLVREAINAGAELAAGKLTADGLAGPVLLTNVRDTMAIFSTEVFGPIALVSEVENVAEAKHKANATPFALGATIFGKESDAMAVAETLDVGVVTINDAVVPAAHPDVTIAARRGSGFGATRGAEGLLAMTRPKAVAINRTRNPMHLGADNDQDEHLLDAYIKAACLDGWFARLSALRAVIRAARNRLLREVKS